MLNLKKIAITGGIASGKSSVCQLFKEHGAFVVSADEIVHKLLSPGTSTYEKISTSLGVEGSGEVFRKAVAEKVFKDPSLLDLVEKILHPVVLEEIKKLYSKISEKGTTSLFIVEIPLLFEIGSETFYDTTITVLTEESHAKKRFAQKGFSEKEYRMRMQRQFIPQKKAEKSDFVINNNGSIEDLKKEVNQILQEL